MTVIKTVSHMSTCTGSWSVYVVNFSMQRSVTSLPALYACTGAVSGERFVNWQRETHVGAFVYDAMFYGVVQVRRILMASISPAVPDSNALQWHFEVGVEHGIGEVRNVLPGVTFASDICLRVRPR